MQSQRNGLAEAAEQAQGLVADTAETMKNAAADMAARASEYSREAGRQASAAAQSAYGAGGDALDMIENFTRGNVWGSLLIAAAVGYGIACLVKNTRGV